MTHPLQLVSRAATNSYVDISSSINHFLYWLIEKIENTNKSFKCEKTSYSKYKIYVKSDFPSYQQTVSSEITYG